MARDKMLRKTKVSVMITCLKLLVKMGGGGGLKVPPIFIYENN